MSLKNNFLIIVVWRRQDMDSKSGLEISDLFTTQRVMLPPILQSQLPVPPHLYIKGIIAQLLQK